MKQKKNYLISRLLDSCKGGYNLFIDDQCDEVNEKDKTIIRDPRVIDPSRNYIKCKTYEEALELIKRKGCPKYISFDHDLGLDTHGKEQKTGYDLAKWLVEQDLDSIQEPETKGNFFPKDFSYQVHSANPIGKRNIEGYLDGYLKQK